MIKTRRSGACVPGSQLHCWPRERRLPGAQLWASRGVLLLARAGPRRRRVYYIRASRIQAALCRSERGAAATVVAITSQQQQQPTGRGHQG